MPPLFRRISRRQSLLPVVRHAHQRILNPNPNQPGNRETNRGPQFKPDLPPLPGPIPFHPRRSPNQPLPNNRPPGPRRNGRGLPCRRPQAGTTGSAQVPPRQTRTRPNPARPLPQRSPHRSPGRPPQRLPHVHDIGEIGPSGGSGRGVHYLSMEYIDGEDLATLIAENRPIAGRQSRTQTRPRAVRRARRGPRRRASCTAT